MTPVVDAVETAFRSAFDRPPDGVWRAPGRVNLIGEHTDYNGGYVLPLAIDLGVTVAASPRTDGIVTARSRQAPEAGVEVRIDELDPDAAARLGWAAYPLGVVWALDRAGHRVPGIDVIVDGDLSQGSGLSSSAALECATAVACADLFGFTVPVPALAAVAQRAENDFVGMPCGIMDQTISLMGRRGRALFLDTLTLATEHLPLGLDATGLILLVIDTKAPHRLVDGEYADRRRACEAAARRLGVARLREVDAEQLPEAMARLDDPVLGRRLRHVVTENARVLAVVDLLRRGEPRAAGPALVASHASLRDDYEVSAPELDAAVDAALASGALGARMTGGGFGGCAIALVDAGRIDHVVEAVTSAFAANGFDPPDIWPAQAADGARRLR